MNVFLDANILISVLNKEYPLFTYSSRILSLGGRHNITLFTSPLCLAIAFYFSAKKSGEVQAKNKIKILSEKLRLTTINEEITKSALNNPQIHDFEDGMQYYSAVDKACKCIITEDREDFYFSGLEVLDCEQFILKYL